MSEILQSQETIKLFEHEDLKPELDDVLEHHGILGMHWGRRNGPPYPLDSKISTGKRLKKAGGKGSISRKRRRALKKARKVRAKNLKIKTEQKIQEQKKQAEEQQKQKTKEDIINSKDVKAMLANIDMFTTNEINTVLTRISTERNLKTEVDRQKEADKSAGRKIVDFAAKNAKEAATNIASNAVKKGVEVLAKKAIGEATKEAKPEVREAIDTIFNINRPETTKSKPDKIPSIDNLEKMVSNIGNYSTKDIKEVVSRINTENNARRVITEELEKQRKKK